MRFDCVHTGRDQKVLGQPGMRSGMLFCVKVKVMVITKAITGVGSPGVVASWVSEGFLLNQALQEEAMEAGVQMRF